MKIHACIAILTKLQILQLNKMVHSAHGRPQEFFQGGANLWGGPKKICEGGPHIFFRQALKYVYRRGGGVVLMPTEFFFSRGPKSIKVDLQNL